MKLSKIELGLNSNSIDKLSLSITRMQEELQRATEPFRLIREALVKRNPKFIEEDWYLSEPVFRKLKIFDMYTTDTEKLEAELVHIFHKDIITIKDRLIGKNQHRTDIINELFSAFNCRHYHSVVILAYSITDGISKEKFGLKFWGYDKNEKKTMSTKISEQIESESVFDIIKKQLYSRGELTQVETIIEVENRKLSYNRHCVVHGDSFLYGTEKNAIKSILLLDFISSLS
jgi:hypothetical protein